jgi:hypothetical protein
VGDARLDYDALTYSWFDYWLKGQENGVKSKLPRVQYYTMGSNKWQQSETWPPKEALATPFYLSSKYKITVKDRFEYSEIDIIFEQNIELNREFLLKEILNVSKYILLEYAKPHSILYMKNNSDHYHVNNSIYYKTIVISMISNLFVTPCANLSIYLYPIFYSYER